MQEMQNMIKKIIEVDKKAKETVDEARREKENVEKKLLEAKRAYESEYNMKAQEKIEKMREKYLACAAEQEEKIREDFEKRQRILGEKFSAASDEWAEMIAARAIGD